MPKLTRAANGCFPSTTRSRNTTLKNERSSTRESFCCPAHRRRTQTATPCGTPARHKKSNGTPSLPGESCLPYRGISPGAARRLRHAGSKLDTKNPSEQAKFAFALLPARRGLVNRSRQKFALLFLAGTVFFCCALLFSAHCAARSAAPKGAPPPFIPCKLFEKSLTKNFTVLAV